MTAEHEIQSKIMLAVSQHNCLIARTNVGKRKTIDGRWFNAGPPPGWPDLTGCKYDNGKIFFIECKNEKGKPRDVQIKFHKLLQKHNIIHGIARSVDDALKIIDKELVGYGFEKYD